MKKKIWKASDIEAGLQTRPDRHPHTWAIVQDVNKAGKRYAQVNLSAGIFTTRGLSAAKMAEHLNKTRHAKVTSQPITVEQGGQLSVRMEAESLVFLLLPDGGHVAIHLSDNDDAALPELDIVLVNADGSDRPEVVNLYKSGLKKAAPAVEACQLIIPLDRRRDVNDKANST